MNNPLIVRESPINFDAEEIFLRLAEVSPTTNASGVLFAVNLELTETK